jgi:fumarylpyruvate hydrolase
MAQPLWALPRSVVPIHESDRSFPVRRIYCVGRNYVDHIREMKEGDERDDPFFFQKPADATVLSGSRIPYPPFTDEFEFEGELVVALGAEGAAVPASAACGLIFGYAAGIDLTRRDRQRECRAQMRPWEAGKSFDHSAPCGPISPADKHLDLNGRRLELTVNDEMRQQTSLDLMIWNVPAIIAQLSLQYRLMPGDLIYTGTPAGVGALASGDTVTVTIDGLPSLSITVD